MKQNSLNVKEKKLYKVAFSQVGCEKNLVDTEHMQGLLDKEGYEVDNNVKDANVVVVNTCSFIETARKESIRKILEYTNQGKEVVVAGCMALKTLNRRNKKDLKWPKIIIAILSTIGTVSYTHLTLPTKPSV